MRKNETMTIQRRQHSGAFKAKVALEAIRGERTVNEIAADYGVHPVQITQWKRVALEALPDLFSSRRGAKHKDEETLKAAWYQQIGQLKVEVDWLKKKLALSVEQKRQLLEPGHPQVSLRRQCALLGLAHTSLYYRPVGESAENEHLMRLLDTQYTATPFYGSRRMTAWLRSQGYAVNRKRVTRLMQQMGMEAIDTKPQLSQAAEGHAIYPSLLRGVQIERVNHVWSTDITYIRLQQGFISLVAVIDWFSRYGLSWALSITLDGAFCLEALEHALRGGRPELFNTDQGAQCTSRAFTERLSRGGIQISMDGRGRALDNVFVERLWRTVKYEEVSLREYNTVREAQQGLGRYFGFYNDERLHQALGYRTPTAVYCGLGQSCP
jgi:putative transposase